MRREKKVRRRTQEMANAAGTVCTISVLLTKNEDTAIRYAECVKHGCDVM